MGKGTPGAGFVGLACYTRGVSSPTTVAGSSPTTVFTPVTAPSGSGFVTIPGGTPGVSIGVAGQPAVPGPQNDGSDFYGLAIAVVVIVGAIFLVRRLVPLRRGGSYTASRRSQPPPPLDATTEPSDPVEPEDS